MFYKRIIFIGLILSLLPLLFGCSKDYVNNSKNYKLTVGVKPEGTGKVTVEPQKDKYEKDEKVTLTASGKDGYNFAYWVGSGYDGNENNSLTFTVTEDLTLVAVFEDNTAPSSPTINGVSSGTYNKTQSFTISGEEATIEYSIDGGRNWIEYSSEVTLSSEGTYEILARQIDKAGNISSNTAVITVKIDKTEPNWITVPYITTPTDASSVGVSFVLNEEGSVYYKVQQEGETFPSAEEVKSTANSILVHADTEREIMINNLTSGTNYSLFFAAVDKAGNLQEDSTVKEVAIKTTALPEAVTVSAGTTSSNNGNLSLNYDIQMGKYEVTNAEFLEFLNSAEVESDGMYKGKEVVDLDSTDCQIGYNGSDFYLKDWTDPDGTTIDIGSYPVIEVTWYGTLAYCNWLSHQDNLTTAYNLSNWELKGSPVNLEGYILPTREEWEYAARGGAAGEVTIYAGSDNIEEVGWYGGNSDAVENSNLYDSRGTMPVGQKLKNELGIYDMSGNVAEWTTTFQSNNRVKCGGDWYHIDNNCEVSSAFISDPANSSYTIGFRITRTK